jgi:hypothetical protein
VRGGGRRFVFIKEVVIMKCQKCGGWMSFEHFLHTENEGIPWSYEGWRCVYCGEVVDPLILLNRKRSISKKKTHDDQEEKVATGHKKH